MQRHQDRPAFAAAGRAKAVRTLLDPFDLLVNGRLFVGPPRQPRAQREVPLAQIRSYVKYDYFGGDDEDDAAAGCPGSGSGGSSGDGNEDKAGPEQWEFFRAIKDHTSRRYATTWAAAAP
ncbi:hypothetical protein PG997_000132 [Apiospora hydei]|uniref:Uncharacterized protein n=1 Tax=Apiospora hydei TaxID=1337664 RepID=A0ABR1X9W7_9PEZI